MKKLILYFFLLILEVSLNFILDIVYKHSRFSKIVSKKSLKFVLGKRNGPITFDLGLILLPVKIDPLIKEQNCKKYAFGTFCTSGFEMIFILPIKVVAFYIQVSTI